jgi:hypothetical protein
MDVFRNQDYSDEPGFWRKGEPARGAVYLGNGCGLTITLLLAAVLIVVMVNGLGFFGLPGWPWRLCKTAGDGRSRPSRKRSVRA